MTNRTHDAFAFAALVTAAVYFPPNDLNLTTLAACLVGNIVGGTLPDVDQASNRLWDLLPAGENIGRYLRKVFIQHRTLTHSVLGVFIVYRVFVWLLPKILNPDFIHVNLVLISIMIGYLSHLIADSLTEEGLPLLFPFKFKFGLPPVKSWRIKTGKWFEKFVVLPGVWVYVIWFVIKRQNIILQILKGIN